MTDESIAKEAEEVAVFVRTAIEDTKSEWNEARLIATFGQNMLGITGMHRLDGGSPAMLEVGHELMRPLLRLRSALKAADGTSVTSLRVHMTKTETIAECLGPDNEDQSSNPSSTKSLQWDWPDT